jgi:uncharacterized protein YraI
MLAMVGTPLLGAMIYLGWTAAPVWPWPVVGLAVACIAYVIDRQSSFVALGQRSGAGAVLSMLVWIPFGTAVPLAFCYGIGYGARAAVG